MLGLKLLSTYVPDVFPAQSLSLHVNIFAFSHFIQNKFTFLTSTDDWAPTFKKCCVQVLASPSIHLAAEYKVSTLYPGIDCRCARVFGKQKVCVFTLVSSENRARPDWNCNRWAQIKFMSFYRQSFLNLRKRALHSYRTCNTIVYFGFSW